MDDNRILIFPFDKTVCPIARYREMLQGYKISGILSPRYLRLNGIDIADIDGGNDTGILISDYKEEALDQCDTIFMHYSRYVKDKEVYSNIISCAISKGKKVLLTKDLKEKLSDVDLDNISYFHEEVNMTEDEFISERLFDMEVPVVTIMGLGEMCNKFNVEIEVRKHFVERGYKVSQIGSEEYSKLFGMHCIPDFIYRKDMDLQNKVIEFNHYVKELLKIEKPDLLIMGVPGGMFKYNNRILDDLGASAYVMTNAVKSDIGIVSVYDNEYNEEYIKALAQCCRYRFDSIIHYFNIANIRVMENEENKSKLDYLLLKSQYVSSHISNEPFVGEYKIFNILNESDAREVGVEIERELSSNVDMIS